MGYGGLGGPCLVADVEVGCSNGHMTKQNVLWPDYKNYLAKC